MRRCLRVLPAAGLPLVLTALAAVGLALPAAASDPPPFTAGEIRLLTADGGHEIELRYRFKCGHLRIDRPERIIPAPAVNVLDLSASYHRLDAPGPPPFDPAK